jgi:hypothetical protein
VEKERGREREIYIKTGTLTKIVRCKRERGEKEGKYA